MALPLEQAPSPEYEAAVGGGYATPVSINADHREWTAVLVALLPSGRAWNKNLQFTGTYMPDNVLHTYLNTLAGEISRFDERTNDLMKETNPWSALEVLDDWERICGIPDECSTEIADNPTARRAAILTKMTNRGGQSISFFYNMAEIWGYTIGTGTFDLILLYDNEASGPFEVQETITGGTTAQTAVIEAVTDFGAHGALALRAVTGAFQDNETITGSVSSATGSVNGILGDYFFLYNNETSGPFTVGEQLIGQVSGAVGDLVGLQDDGATGKMNLINVVVGFAQGENFIGQTSGAQAYVFSAPAPAPGLHFQIVEFVPCMAGRAGAGDPCGDEKWWFTWQVKGTAVLPSYFRAGTPCGFPVRSWAGGDVMTCYITMLKPAHTLAVYTDTPL